MSFVFRQLGVILIAIISSLSYAASIQNENLRCSDQHSYVRHVAHYTIRIVPHGDPEEGFCTVILKNESSSKTVTTDWSVSILPVSGKDLNGDGVPDLVVETYSGGAHCCWTYWVVSLGKIPTTVLHFENQRAADFSQEHDGKPIIHTLEGRFDYLRTSHAGSFFPDIYLRLDGRRLV